MMLPMEATMQCELSYRGYLIYFDGRHYVAETHPDEGDIFLHMRSRSLERVLAAIDGIHACTDDLPEWLAAVWGTGEDAFVDLDIHFVQTTA
jgi:hypothetical protein